MNIAGVIVHTRPEQVAALEKTLAAMPGVEVHARTDDGRLIVTVEDDPSSPSDRDPDDIVMNLHHLEGVLCAALVYHHFEPDSGAQETAHEAEPA